MLCGCMQEAVERREAEIVRLGAEAGGSRDLDVTALQYRSEAQENLILQLNEQVPSAHFSLHQRSISAICMWLRSVCVLLPHQ